MSAIVKCHAIRWGNITKGRLLYKEPPLMLYAKYPDPKEKVTCNESTLSLPSAYPDT